MLVPVTLNDSTSWAELKPLVIDAVADTRLAPSSATVSEFVTWVAASFSVYASVEVSMPLSTGAVLLLGAATLMSRDWVLLAWFADWPSSTWNVTVRCAVFGVLLLLKYLTVRSTFW